MAETIALQHASWGVGDKLPSPFNGCVVTDIDKSDEDQHAYEYDQKGRVIGDVIYDRRKSITCTIQVPKTLTLPNSGTVINLGDSTTKDNYILRSIRLIQTNREYRKVQLSMERWTNDVTPTDETGDEETQS